MKQLLDWKMLAFCSKQFFLFLATDPHRLTRTFLPADFAGRKSITKLAFDYKIKQIIVC